MDETQYRIKVEFFLNNQYEDEYTSRAYDEEYEAAADGNDAVAIWVNEHLDTSKPAFYTIRVTPQFLEEHSNVWESA